jgi:hypothetical protein
LLGKRPRARREGHGRAPIYGLAGARDQGGPFSSGAMNRRPRSSLLAGQVWARGDKERTGDRIATAAEPRSGSANKLGWDARGWAIRFDVGRCWESDVGSGKLVIDKKVQRAKRRGEVGAAR